MIKNEDLNSGNQLLQGESPGLPQGLCAGLLLGPGVCGWTGAGFFGGDGAGFGGDGAGFVGDDVDIIVVIIYAPCC